MSKLDSPLPSLTFADMGLKNKGPISSVSPDYSIQDALNLLAANNYLSLPVRSQSNASKISTIVGMMDFVRYFVDKTGGDEEKLKDEGILKDSVESLMSLESDVESYRIWERDIKDTLDTTLDAFSKKTHRALVTDSSNPKAAILVTQTDILRFVLENPATMAHIESKLSLPISSLVPKKEVWAISDRDSTFSGFKIIKEKRIPAVPVLNNAGQVVASLSSSDLRGLTTANISDLSMNVVEFLKKHSQRAGESATALQISPEATLKEAMEKLASHHLHRLWVTDDSLRTCGVFSLSDLMGILRK